MNTDIAPTGCLDFEPAEARALQWLPLAVRYKLDQVQLKLSLGQWQGLPLAHRQGLVRCLAEDGFEELARQAGAYPASCGGRKPPDAVRVGELLGCARHEAQLWLAGASPFARYVMAKRIEGADRSGARLPGQATERAC